MNTKNISYDNRYIDNDKKILCKKTIMDEMSTTFIECVICSKYQEILPDGTPFGGWNYRPDNEKINKFIDDHKTEDICPACQALHERILKEKERILKQYSNEHRHKCDGCGE